jgi:hypothetical protein
MTSLGVGTLITILICSLSSITTIPSSTVTTLLNGYNHDQHRVISDPYRRPSSRHNTSSSTSMLTTINGAHYKSSIDTANGGLSSDQQQPCCSNSNISMQSLDQWMRSQPFSLLRLDRTDRLIMMIAGTFVYYYRIILHLLR